MPNSLRQVTLYSRQGCHLCEVAEATLREVRETHPFELEIVDIDQSPELVAEYGEEIPVTVIDGLRHDYFRVDRERFTKAILHQHR